VESAGRWKITGWAHDAAHPQLPELPEFLTAGQVIGTALARGFRKDLQKAGKGAGNCAFSFTPPARLRPEDLATLTIRRASDAAPPARHKTILTPGCRKISRFFHYHRLSPAYRPTSCQRPTPNAGPSTQIPSRLAQYNRFLTRQYVNGCDFDATSDWPSSLEPASEDHLGHSGQY
jgi:hypothetical protein